MSSNTIATRFWAHPENPPLPWAACSMKKFFLLSELNPQCWEWGQCSGKIVVLRNNKQLAALQAREWYWREANARARWDLCLRSHKLVLPHRGWRSMTAHRHIQPWCFLPQGGLHADIFCLPQVLDLYKVKKTNCSWIKTAAFHKASRKALGITASLLFWHRTLPPSSFFKK